MELCLLRIIKRTKDTEYRQNCLFTIVNNSIRNKESISHPPLTGGISGMLFLFSAKNRCVEENLLPTISTMQAILFV